MTVLYLKYRPKTFADLDSSDARDALIKLFASGNSPHALLFTGSKGIGKTSAARIVVKSLVCEENKNNKENNFEPCNKCKACLSVDNNSNLDIFEIDAASNRGIDDIRELREKIKLAPSSGQYKVYIIDEVHMLTNESFNALLKTLEEPPPHAYFILCTTDFEKLPKTIVSRCTRIHFKKASKAEVLNRLVKVANLENISFDEPGLAVLINASEGSFRDAIKLLEQASSLGKVTEENAMIVVGLNKDFPVDQLLGLLEKREVSLALDWLGKANEANINFKLLISEMVEQLRQLMLKSFGVAIEPSLSEYVFSLDQIKQLIRLLQQANLESRQAIIPSLPLEMAVVEYLSSEGGDVTGGEVEEDREAKTETRGIVEDVKVELVKNETSSHINLPVDHNLEGSWSKILEAVKPLNHSVLAFLRASRPLSLDNKGNLTIEVFYKFHKDQLETDRCRRIFEQAAGNVLATDIKLKCVLGEGKPRVVSVEEPVYEVHLTSPLPKKSTDDIIDMAEQIFNGGGTIQ